jgi:hypothetical protein
MLTRLNATASLLALCQLMGCGPHVKQIGDLNMIATRNVDASELSSAYVPLRTYAGGSKRELKKSTASSIEEAANATVRAVPGGEFLMNVKVYLIDGMYIAIEGDVWGRNSASVRGFKIGDAVVWKRFGSYARGKVVALKDEKTCLVEPVGGGKVTEVAFEDLLAAQGVEPTDAVQGASPTAP